MVTTLGRGPVADRSHDSGGHAHVPDNAGGCAVTNWLDLPDDDPWGLQNLAYGSLRDQRGRRFVAVRIGDRVLDLTSMTAGTASGALFASGTLNDFLAAGRPVWADFRATITAALTDADRRAGVEPFLSPLDEHTPELAFDVADYVDFYASEHHASNVGRIFRPGSSPLTPNWKHQPLGYHGRAGTIVVTGTTICRPSGQVSEPGAGISFGPSTRMDIEAEVGFVVGVGSTLGEPVRMSQFREHVFGVCLVNDWSARDIQAWESVPLGPFLGKSFATSVSGWITPLDALEDAWVAPPSRDPAPPPYLNDSEFDLGLDLLLEVSLNGSRVSRPPFAQLYWTPAQLMAHLTANGASLRSGDLFASGTVSGADRAQRGSLLELGWNGATPLQLADGSQRSFLLDDDDVVITATARAEHGRIALGEVRGRIGPSAP